MTEKTMRYQGKNKDLNALSKEIVQYLMADGYQVQSNKASDGFVIQAKKEGFLRDIVTANRAFTIQLNGKPNDFTIRMGVGKFIQNLAVAAAETLIVSELFLAVDVPEMIWTQFVEDGVAKDIDKMVNSQTAHVKPAKGGK